jgi:RHS repeat-associated protein
VGGNVLTETDGSGNVLNDYVYFAGGRIGRANSSGKWFYYGDHLGSSRSITDSSGNLCYDADFYLFGAEKAVTNTCAQNYKWTGLERDSETGLDHTLNRQYSSNTGRWLSPDSARGSAPNPQSWDRYSYVLNNSTNLTDRLGLQPQGQPQAWSTGNCTPCGYSGSPCYWEGWGPSNALGVQCLSGSCVQMPASAAVPPQFDVFAMQSGDIQGAEASYVNSNCLRCVYVVGWVGNQLFARLFSSLDAYFDFNTGLALQDQLARQNLNRLNAQLNGTIAAAEAEGADEKQIQRFVIAALFRYNNGGIKLQGGNLDFPNYDVYGDKIFNFTDCAKERCDNRGYGSLDFSHDDNTVHLDTANVWNIPFGSVPHSFVDYFLGNVWYDIIPRPWP